eukprot:758976-Hanusia_phi.AAC.1
MTHARKNNNASQLTQVKCRATKICLRFRVGFRDVCLSCEHGEIADKQQSNVDLRAMQGCFDDSDLAILLRISDLSTRLDLSSRVKLGCLSSPMAAQRRSTGAGPRPQVASPLPTFEERMLDPLSHSFFVFAVDLEQLILSANLISDIPAWIGDLNLSKAAVALHDDRWKANSPSCSICQSGRISSSECRVPCHCLDIRVFNLSNDEHSEPSLYCLTALQEVRVCKASDVT